MVIGLDYGMRGGKAKIPVRKALLYYALKRLGLDAERTARRPQDQKIVPCLSGYHPHPLYVVCLLGLQARAGAGALRRRSG